MKFIGHSRVLYGETFRVCHCESAVLYWANCSEFLSDGVIFRIVWLFLMRFDELDEIVLVQWL